MCQGPSIVCPNLWFIQPEPLPRQRPKCSSACVVHVRQICVSRYQDRKLSLPAILCGSPHGESPKDASEVLLSLKATFRGDINHWGFRFLQQLFRLADSK
jgi:hypothetical protein